MTHSFCESTLRFLHALLIILKLSALYIRRWLEGCIRFRFPEGQLIPSGRPFDWEHLCLNHWKVEADVFDSSVRLRIYAVYLTYNSITIYYQ